SLTTTRSCSSSVSSLSASTSTAEIFTVSLHDALPISAEQRRTGRHRLAVQSREVADAVPFDPVRRPGRGGALRQQHRRGRRVPADRKSTRLNSSHVKISYAVFCLKKKRKKPNISTE